MTTTTINLSQDIHTHAKATAAARGISLSALIEVALRRELAPTRPRRGVRLPSTAGQAPIRASTLGRLRAVWDSGAGVSLDLLGEATVTAAEADQYAERSADAIDVLASATRDWPGRPVLASTIRLISSTGWKNTSRNHFSLGRDTIYPWRRLTRNDNDHFALRARHRSGRSSG